MWGASYDGFAAPGAADLRFQVFTTSITVFLTNIPDDYATYNRIYAEYFDAASGPCRTTVEISRLPTPIAIELKCLALAPRTAED